MDSSSDSYQCISSCDGIIIHDRKENKPSLHIKPKQNTFLSAKTHGPNASSSFIACPSNSLKHMQQVERLSLSSIYPRSDMLINRSGACSQAEEEALGSSVFINKHKDLMEHKNISELASKNIDTISSNALSKGPRSDDEFLNNQKLSRKRPRPSDDFASKANDCDAKPIRDPNHWTEEEDALLIKARALVSERLNEETDSSFWGTVASLVPNRTSKQCRERFKFNLDPDIIKDDFTSEEDTMILKKQIEIGNKWALISKSIPGRSENAVKTRYKSIKRAQEKAWRKEEDNIILKSLGYMNGEKLKQTEFEAIISDLANTKLTRIPRTRNAIKTRYKRLVTGTADEYKRGDPLQSEFAREGVEIEATKSSTSLEQENAKIEKEISHPQTSQLNESSNSNTSSISENTPIQPSSRKKKKTNQDSKPNEISQVHDQKEKCILPKRIKEQIPKSLANPLGQTTKLKEGGKSKVSLIVSGSVSPTEAISLVGAPASTPKKSAAIIHGTLGEKKSVQSKRDKTPERSIKRPLQPIITPSAHDEAVSRNESSKRIGLKQTTLDPNVVHIPNYRSTQSFDNSPSQYPSYFVPSHQTYLAEPYDNTHDIRAFIPDFDEVLNFSLLSPSGSMTNVHPVTPPFYMSSSIETSQNDQLSSPSALIVDHMISTAMKSDGEMQSQTSTSIPNVDMHMLLGTTAIQATYPCINGR